MRGPSFAALAALGALSLAGCQSELPPDTAIMPTTAVGTPVLSDVGAIETAAYNLGIPSRTHGHPDQAALALASVDYLAGALYSNPHWVGLSAIAKIQMVQGRGEVRSVLGIPPGTPSQVVVSDLIHASDALGAGDMAAARAALPANVFTMGPDRTIAFLSNLPYLEQANVAAQAVNADTMTNCGNTMNCG